MTYYYGENFSQNDVHELVDAIYSGVFEEESRDFFENFDEALGSDYDVTYEIVDVEKNDFESIDGLNSSIRDVTNAVAFSSIRTVEIEVTGKNKYETYSDTMFVYFSFENFTWKAMFAEKLF